MRSVLSKHTLVHACLVRVGALVEERWSPSTDGCMTQSRHVMRSVAPTAYLCVVGQIETYKTRP